jgi:hypothetical protein
VGFRLKIDEMRPLDRLFECREKEAKQGDHPLASARLHIGVIRNASIPRQFRPR